MKKTFGLLATVISIYAVSCSDAKGSYIDLKTGEKIEVEKDDKTGVWINAETKEPVYIYVDTKKNDTIYGKTGNVINGHIVKTEDNVYWYDGDEEYKVKYSDYKMKVEKDGDIKIKDGDTKTKIDGETGEKKVKKD
jgi:hypothetical protein